MDRHKFIFVVGLHRSGTSFLAQCLGQHPQISCFSDTGVIEDEGQFLQTVFPLDQYYGGAGRMGFNPEVHLTEDSPLVNANNRQKLFAEWSQHWDLGMPYLLEKTPGNLLRTRFLQELFPDSYFIAIRRHPIPVSLSTQRMSSRTGFYALIEHWLSCYQLFERDRQHLKNVYSLKYEDMIVDFDGCLREIADFLSLEPWTPSLRIKASANERQFAEWRKLVAAYDATFDRSTLRGKGLRRAFRHLSGKLRWLGYEIIDSSAETRDAIFRLEDQVQEFGYSLKDV